MRLEVFCENRLGIARELLDLLVTRDIDLRGIELESSGRIYLYLPKLDFEIFGQLMGEIRRIQDVTDVRTVTAMPSEREMKAMWSLLESLPEPVLSIDLKGKVSLANQAALRVFTSKEGQPILGEHIGNLINGFNFHRWLDNDATTPHSCRISLRQHDYLMDITPIQLEGDEVSLQPVGAVIELKSMSKLGRQLHTPLHVDDAAFQAVTAYSPAMKQVVEQAKKLALLDAPLLILGETGSGKDLLAYCCHQYSARQGKPFLALNCAALPDDVAESELFGHAAGAYPNALEGKKGFFEQANGGSVLLDSIGEMSPQMQAKLLRFLNDGTFRRVGEDQEVRVDVRVICATQKNLTDLMKEGVFREDLYYRLNVLTLHIPPLRERQQDILPLTEAIIHQICEEQGVKEPLISADIIPLLNSYSWPGNVRQLKNVLYRALAQLEGIELRPQDIVLPESKPQLVLGEENLTGSLDEICKRFERSVLVQLYQDFPSTRKLAKRLNVSHTAIANKLREYGLSSRRSVSDSDDA